MLKLRCLNFAILVVVALGTVDNRASAALVLSDFSTVTQNFDAYRGTAGTVPSPWVTAGDLVFHDGDPNDGNAQNGVFTDGSTLYAALPGWWALNSTAAPNDYAFGLRTQTGSTSSLTVTLTNGTGSTWDKLNIGWNFEQYTEGFGNGRVSLLWSTDGSTFSTTDLTGDLLANGAFGASPPAVYTTPAVTTKATMLDTDITSGQTFYLRFLWTSVKSGNQPHIGIDNVALTPFAVPEPSGLALALSGALALGIGLYRRNGASFQPRVERGPRRLHGA